MLRFTTFGIQVIKWDWEVKKLLRSLIHTDDLKQKIVMNLPHSAQKVWKSGYEAA